MPTTGENLSRINAALTADPSGLVTGSTLITTGQTTLGGSPGAEGLRVLNTASAVSRVEISGSSGINPSIVAEGSGTDLNLTVAQKGANQLLLGTTAGTARISGLNVALGYQGSSSNYAQVYGGTSGQPVRLQAVGVDTDVNLDFYGKGAGTIRMQSDVTFMGTGRRIRGDFSNATAYNRVLFQTTTANASTNVGAIPSGTGSGAVFATYNAADPDNAAYTAIVTDNTMSYISTGKTGTGSVLPLSFQVAGGEALRIDTSKNVLVTGSGGLGYGSGSGGTVTQATSKSTAVTLNKPTGRITMTADALAANTRVSFLLNNSLITSNDVVHACLTGGSSNPDEYLIRCRPGPGGVTISVINQSGASLSDAIVITYVVIRGAIT